MLPVMSFADRLFGLLYGLSLNNGLAGHRHDLQ
jgi:hypothetical protein